MEHDPPQPSGQPLIEILHLNPKKNPALPILGCPPSMGSVAHVAQPEKQPGVDCGSGSAPRVSPPTRKKGPGQQGWRRGCRDPAPTQRTPKLPGGRGDVTRHQPGRHDVPWEHPAWELWAALGPPRDPPGAGRGEGGCPCLPPRAASRCTPQKRAGRGWPHTPTPHRWVHRDHRGLPTASGHRQDPPFPRPGTARPPPRRPAHPPRPVKALLPPGADRDTPPVPPGSAAAQPGRPHGPGPGSPAGYRCGGGVERGGVWGGGGQNPVPHRVPPWPGRAEATLPRYRRGSPALQAPRRAALTRVMHHAGLAAFGERPPCGETHTVSPPGPASEPKPAPVPAPAPGTVRREGEGRGGEGERGENTPQLTVARGDGLHMHAHAGAGAGAARAPAAPAARGRRGHVCAASAAAPP